MYGYVWHNISAYKLRQTHLIELERGEGIKGIIEQNLKEISYEHTVTPLHLCANDINSGPFSVYVHGNSLETLYCYITL